MSKIPPWEMRERLRQHRADQERKLRAEEDRRWTEEQNRRASQERERAKQKDDDDRRSREAPINHNPTRSNNPYKPW